MNELTRLACVPESALDLHIEQAVVGDDEQRSVATDYSARVIFAASHYSRRGRRSDWSSEDLRRLRDLAGTGTPLNAIAAALRRTASSVRNKAGMHGISLRMPR